MSGEEVTPNIGDDLESTNHFLYIFLYIFVLCFFLVETGSREGKEEQKNIEQKFAEPL
jgi:hypothetical protein